MQAKKKKNKYYIPQTISSSEWIFFKFLQNEFFLHIADFNMYYNPIYFRLLYISTSEFNFVLFLT